MENKATHCSSDLVANFNTMLNTTGLSAAVQTPEEVVLVCQRTSVLVAACERLVGRISCIVRKPTTQAERAANIDAAVSEVSAGVLHSSMSHIAGCRVVAGDIEDIQRLVEILASLCATTADIIGVPTEGVGSWEVEYETPEADAAPVASPSVPATAVPSTSQPAPFSDLQPQAKARRRQARPSKQPQAAQSPQRKPKKPSVRSLRTGKPTPGTAVAATRPPPPPRAARAGRPSGVKPRSSLTVGNLARAAAEASSPPGPLAHRVSSPISPTHPADPPKRGPSSSAGESWGDPKLRGSEQATPASATGGAPAPSLPHRGASAGGVEEGSSDGMEEGSRQGSHLRSRQGSPVDDRQDPMSGSEGDGEADRESGPARKGEKVELGLNLGARAVNQGQREQGKGKQGQAVPRSPLRAGGSIRERLRWGWKSPGKMTRPRAAPQSASAAHLLRRAYGSSPAPRTQPSPSEVDPQEIAEMAEKPGVLDTKENLQCLAKNDPKSIRVRRRREEALLHDQQRRSALYRELWLKQAVARHRQVAMAAETRTYLASRGRRYEDKIDRIRRARFDEGKAAHAEARRLRRLAAQDDAFQLAFRQAVEAEKAMLLASRRPATVPTSIPSFASEAAAVPPRVAEQARRDENYRKHCERLEAELLADLEQRLWDEEQQAEAEREERRYLRASLEDQYLREIDKAAAREDANLQRSVYHSSHISALATELQRMIHPVS